MTARATIFLTWLTIGGAIEIEDVRKSQAACENGFVPNEYMITLTTDSDTGTDSRRLEQAADPADFKAFAASWAHEYETTVPANETRRARRSLQANDVHVVHIFSRMGHGVSMVAGDDAITRMGHDARVTKIDPACLEMVDAPAITNTLVRRLQDLVAGNSTPPATADDGAEAQDEHEADEESPSALPVGDHIASTDSLHADCSQCGYCVTPVAPSECPSYGNLPNCNNVADGELCEGDGECATHNGLNNCNPGYWDIYRRGGTEFADVIHVGRGNLGLPWGLDRVDHAGLGAKSNGQYNDGGANGAGVRVYVVDTGVQATHEDFENRVVAGFGVDHPLCNRCAANAGRIPADGQDCNGHGTHVASTVAGRHHGIAKSATIVPVYACFRHMCANGRRGCGSTLDINAGLDWIIDEDLPAHPGTRAIVQRSLSGSHINEDERLEEADVAVVAAAGNDGVDNCATHYDADRTRSKILVGATNSNDRLTGFSNHGACVHMLAPGEAVDAAYVGPNNDETARLRGTSMAAPHVSGAAAQILQKHPHMSPQQVKDFLVDKAHANQIAGLPAGTPNRLLAAGEPLIREEAMLRGNTYAACQGTYRRSTDAIQGRYIWDRVSPDGSRFIFWCWGRWRVTGSQWRAGMIAQNGHGCGSFISSDNGAAQWYESRWTNAGATAGQLAKLDGRTYATCQGTYIKSHDRIQGRNIWDRVSPDGSRFIFWCWGRWRVTGSQWRAGMIAQDGRGCGSFISSDDGPAEWYDANWAGAGGNAYALF